MAKALKIPEKYQVWIEARRRHHLTDAQVQMARELGLNPRKMDKLPEEQPEPSETPMADYIQELYRKRFGKDQPDQVRSIEQLVQDQRQKKAERKTGQPGAEPSEADSD